MKAGILTHDNQYSVHLSRVFKKYDLDNFYVAGNVYLKGT